LRTLASDEIADLQPILADAAKATGVTVAITPTTSLAGSKDVASGRAGSSYDATWFATNRYLAMTPGALAELDSSTVIMSSPVVLGLRRSVADRLGWAGKPVSWTAIAEAAAAHRFGFGMSDPENSNSGLSALVCVATAVAGNGAALQPSGVAQASPLLKGFFSGQTLKSSSSRVLVDDYLRVQGSDAQGGAVDGIIDYESTLLSLNASGRLREALTLIYPSDGVVTADYTLSLLGSAPPAAKDAYTRLVTYLRLPDSQRRIMQQTRRRPGLPGVPLDADLAGRETFETPFPGNSTVVDNLIIAYYGTLRRPARTVYVLDTSGSMKGDRLSALKAAIGLLTAPEPDSTAPGSTFQTREQITFEPFSDTPRPASTFTVPAQDPQAALSQIGAFVAGLSANGGTAVYDALAAAYTTVAQQVAADPDRITTIVLLTDGENNAGRDLAAFTQFYRGLPAATASVPVYPILFGDTDNKEMAQLAQLTGGRTFDGRKLPLSTVFTLIRGDQ
jgi:Ca-activated chloride channel family protein